MSYLDDVEKELRQEFLDEDEMDEDYQTWMSKLCKFFREKLLESYRNGAQAARRGSDKRSAQNTKSKASK